MVNIHEAKTQFSQLLKRVAGGQEIVISRAGTPIAMLVPYRGKRARRMPGRYAGQGYIAKDFDAPMRDVEDDFYQS